MSSYVEHANITVNDISRTIAFLQTAMPDFSVRGEGKDEDRAWCHIGTDISYIALQQEGIDKPIERIPNYHLGVNHIGFVVEDATRVAENLKTAGFEQVSFDKSHPSRKRAYFYDNDGIEWEFIEYLTEDFGSRNDYVL
ncbi:VOC family protein [Enterovibrio makurazakiensis]|uniref:VOC family protein n=1 Tax=Enterovibrio gelatinilyticus TaxID=2899819 RepID=A0ABT5R1N0_9GAMM|nr:VOC family protein [Enterovibrio sp. ZSDZ42]MDD1794178.1 VOC family protein [Enterovibrio sp. ZSDZ42]